MERYSEYQDTGIAWMPQIPSHWKCLQFRGLFRITKRIAGRKGLDVLAVTQRGIKVKDVESNEGQIAADYSNYQIVEPGDFAMNHMDLITGFIGISPQYGVTSPDYRVFKNISPLANSRYYLYLFELCYKQRIFYGLGHGVSNKGRWRLPAPIQNRFSIPLPPLAEQEKIVSYLDSKTSKIDAYVADKEKEIQMLQELKQKTIAEAVTKGLNPNVKMKDSGISWIGMIPEHWVKRRIKTLFYVINGNGFKIEHQGLENGDYPFLKVSDLNGTNKFVSTAKNYVTKTISKEESYNIIPTGSVLFSKIGEALKRNHRKINTKECCIDNNCSAFVIKEGCMDIDIVFFYYVMKCVDMAWFDNGGTIPCVNMKNLTSSSIPFPPLTEQQAIVSYIEEKSQKIDTLITELQAEIDYLKEYKQRLIADCVTGQMNVQNEK